MFEELIETPMMNVLGHPLVQPISWFYSEKMANYLKKLYEVSDPWLNIVSAPQKDRGVNKIDLLYDYHELGCGVGKRMIRGVMIEIEARWKGEVRKTTKPRNQREAALPTVGYNGRWVLRLTTKTSSNPWAWRRAMAVLAPATLP